MEQHSLGTRAKCYPRDVPDVKSPEFGLERLGVDFKKYPGIPEEARFDLAENDIYYLRDSSGALRTVIVCSAEEARTSEDGVQYRRVSQCQHKFVVKALNAAVSINYRRIYLKEWRKIQDDWEGLLTSFVVERSDGVQKGARPWPDLS